MEQKGFKRLLLHLSPVELSSMSFAVGRGPQHSIA
jgi:hypothetical protein